MTNTNQITGMSCSHCVAKVKSELEKADGVVTAEVLLQQRLAIITMNHPYLLWCFKKQWRVLESIRLPKLKMSTIDKKAD